VGAFYSSIQVRGKDHDAVKTALESVASERGHTYLLGPVLDGWIGVYSDHYGEDGECSALISKRLHTIVLSLIVHDSDVFFCNFFRNGELLNEYSSDPENFETVSASEHEHLKAKPELFDELVNSPEEFAALSQLLDRGSTAPKFDFEENRLEKFASLLGIRNTLTSYEYLTEGERDGVKNWKKFIHIPDQSGEKAAKRVAAAALRAEKQRLQKAGLLCVEWLPPGRKSERANKACQFSFDPLDGSLLLRWASSSWGRYQSPWTSGSQPVEMPVDPIGWHGLVISPNGRWLALFDGKLTLWDRKSQALLKETLDGGEPLQFSHDESLLVCQTQQRISVISLETRQVVQTVETSARIAGESLHPSNKYLVTLRSESTFGIINLESGKLEKDLFAGGKVDQSHLIPHFEGSFKAAGIGQRDLEEWKRAFIQGAHKIMNLRFSPDGRLLFCATTHGLHVLGWNEFLTATESTPKPLFSVMPCPAAVPSVLDERHYANFIYDVVLDQVRDRLLFCGIEGVIRFLDLKDGNSGILLDPPGKSPIWQLRLSPDNKFICCSCTPPVQERNRESPRLQIWNSPAVCHAAGLD
jgi:hypothetical protein